jgi:hypothetical protein
MNLRNKMIIACLFLLAGTFPGLAATTPDQVEIKILHQPGRIARYKMVIKIVGSMKMPDPIPEMKTSQIMVQEYLTKCIKVNPDGSAVYEMSTPRIEMQMDLGGSKGKFLADNNKSTTTPVPSPQTKPNNTKTSELISVMAQVKYTLTVGRDGTPLKVQGYVESLNKALKNAGNFNPVEKMFLNSLRQTMNDDTMLKEMKSKFSILPPRRTLKIGDTWTSSTNMNMAVFNLTNKVIAEYKVIGIEEFHGRPCLKIQTRESMQSFPLPKPASKPATSQPENPFNAMELTLKSNDGNGLAYVDYQTGEIVQYHKTQRMITEATMKNPPGKKSSDNKNTFSARQSAFTSSSLDLLPQTPETASPQK